MVEQNLPQVLIRLSERDVLDGVGRVFLDEVRKEFNISEDDIKKAIDQLKEQYDVRVHDGKILLITLQPRPNRPFTLRGKF